MSDSQSEDITVDDLRALAKIVNVFATKNYGDSSEIHVTINTGGRVRVAWKVEGRKTVHDTSSHPLGAAGFLVGLFVNNVDVFKKRRLQVVK